MIEIQSVCKVCRICKNPDLIDIINIGNQVISIADLTNGVYFLTINSSEGKFVEKLIKN